MRRLSIIVALVAVFAAACSDAGTATTAASTSPAATQPEGGTMPDVPQSTEAADDPEDGSPSTTTPPSTEEPSSRATTPPTTPAPTTIAINPTEESKPPVGGSTSSVFPPGQIDPGLQPFIDMAVDDLASRLGVGPSDVIVVSATVVTWSDSSLGCPQPGMQYAQVLQDGSLIELSHASRFYRYHTGGDTLTPFLCDQPLVTPPLPGGGADV